MLLTTMDKDLLKTWGYPDEDVKQIQRAIKKTTYEMNEEPITASKAVEVL